MKAGLIDTHAHLDGPEFDQDRAAMVQRASDTGVRTIVSASQDEATSLATLKLAREFAGIAPAVGIHPHHAKGAKDMAWLISLLDDREVVAVGEMGLDYHYDFSPRDDQRSIFALQLELAGERSLPAIVHCREAVDDVIRILRAHKNARTPAVVHCFTDSYETGKRLIDIPDIYLGVGGAVTFRNATDLREAVKRLPLDRLVLETDCPYMAPVPHRGKRNEPAYVRLTCEALAALRGTTPDAIAAATTESALRLFPKLKAYVGSSIY